MYILLCEATAISPAAETLPCSSTIWLLELGAGPRKKVSEDAQEQLKINCEANL